jgi:hypothetical protein
LCEHVIGKPVRFGDRYEVLNCGPDYRFGSGYCPNLEPNLDPVQMGSGSNLGSGPNLSITNVNAQNNFSYSVFTSVVAIANSNLHEDQPSRMFCQYLALYAHRSGSASVLFFACFSKQENCMCRFTKMQ